MIVLSGVLLLLFVVAPAVKAKRSGLSNGKVALFVILGDGVYCRRHFGHFGMGICRISDNARCSTRNFVAGRLRYCPTLDAPALPPLGHFEPPEEPPEPPAVPPAQHHARPARRA